MTARKKNRRTTASYKRLASSLRELFADSRRQAARSVNAVLTATYWEIGHRMVQFEQQGHHRADYGATLLLQLSRDLTKSCGRGFSVDNLEMMRRFYLTWPTPKISESVIRKSPATRQRAISESLIRKSSLTVLADCFPLSWTHYTRLIPVTNTHARHFYETEALRGGWSVRQLERQIDSQFYERTALSRDKSRMLRKGALARTNDIITPEQMIREPYVLEFLGLKDEYSETDLENALIQHLETFILEMGADFTFVARQKRLRLGHEWFRVDLVLYHRRLRCLVLIDLKLGRFSHTDVGQLHLYLNYAKTHWTHADENPPVGLILCAAKNAAVVKYALDGLPNKIVAAEYRTALPNEKILAKEIDRTRRALDAHAARQNKRTIARRSA